MMRYVFTTSILLLFLFGLAKSQEIKKDDNFAGIGLGPSMNYAGLSAFGLTPAVRLTFERGVIDMAPGVVSMGGVFGFSHQVSNIKTLTEYHYWGDESMVYSRSYLTTFLGFRSAWYYNFGEFDYKQFNVYAGATIGLKYQFVFDKIISGNKVNSYTEPVNNAFPYFSGFVGANWHFSDSWAVFLVLGYDISWTTGGLIYRF